MIENPSILKSDANKIINIANPVKDYPNLKYVQFSGGEDGDTGFYFTYILEKIPDSKTISFNVNYNSMDETGDTKNYVLCLDFDENAGENDIKTAFSNMKRGDQKSICTESPMYQGKLDGLIKVNNKKKIAFYLYNAYFKSELWNAQFYVSENQINVFEEHKKSSSIFYQEYYNYEPNILKLQDFRSLNYSKLILYSKTRELNGYIIEENSNSPQFLFKGHLLSIFTNENTARQKYKGATTIIIITGTLGEQKGMTGETLYYSITGKFDYPLDYFVSANTEGRTLDKPLSIQIDECEKPHYFIYNYNKPEVKKTLFIDSIYGQIETFEMANEMKANTWDDMIKNDIKEKDFDSYQFDLPEDRSQHIDIFRIKCKNPLLLNFYFSDQNPKLTDLEMGNVVLFNLPPNRNTKITFNEKVQATAITISVFDPKFVPNVILYNPNSLTDNVVQINKNQIVKFLALSVTKGLEFLERGSSETTRIIIKIGYNDNNWKDEGDNVKYNSELGVYKYSFKPNDYNTIKNVFTVAGINDVDNVKFCYVSNIGAAIAPGKENCYRVTKSNTYQIEFYNPNILYQNYDYDDSYEYFITFQPQNKDHKIKITPISRYYSTNYRNKDGEMKVIQIPSELKNEIILSPIRNAYPKLFVQLQACYNIESSNIKYEVKRSYDSAELVKETPIEAKKTYFFTFDNNHLDNLLYLTGNYGDIIFTKFTGIPYNYNPVPRELDITFEAETYQIIIQRPITNEEEFKYSILIGKENALSTKSFSLCNFVNGTELIPEFYKSRNSNAGKFPVYIDFEKFKMNENDKFEILVFAEQVENSKLAFLSKVFTFTVPKKPEGFVNQITVKDKKDENQNTYYYINHTVSSTDKNFNDFFSLEYEGIPDSKMGTMRIILDDNFKGEMYGINCAFVPKTATDYEMLEAIQNIVESNDDYCIGNFIENKHSHDFAFKYGEKDQKMVIKLSNKMGAQGLIHIYISQGIVKVNHQTAQYGEKSSGRFTLAQYYFDLELLRNEQSQTQSYNSKILLYSQNHEMEVYYISEDKNTPQKLFNGNILMMYTKKELAVQKYHSTKLILISDMLSVAKDPLLGEKYQFEMKLFKSNENIEYLVSTNNNGRTLYKPLNLEISECQENSKVYYIYNYNKAEEEKIMYIEFNYGAIESIKINKDFNSESWDEFVSNFENVQNYEAKLIERKQHIDVLEIKCKMPFNMNIYYAKQGNIFNNIKMGDIVVDMVEGNKQTTISVESTSLVNGFPFSISSYNPENDACLAISFDKSNGESSESILNGNQIISSFVLGEVSLINIYSCDNRKERVIFKIGYNLNDYSEWQFMSDKKYYYNNNQRIFVYSFPNDKLVKSVNIKTISSEDNVKYCYSFNRGVPIQSGSENCFRTGSTIPYTIKFTNPIIMPTNYEFETDKMPSYITIVPMNKSSALELVIEQENYKSSLLISEYQASTISINQEKETNAILEAQHENVPYLTIHFALCSGSSNAKYEIKNAYTELPISTENEIGSGFKFETLDNKLYDVLFTLKDKDESSKTKIYIKPFGKADTKEIISNIVIPTFSSETNEITITKPNNGKYTYYVLVKKQELDDLTFSLCDIIEIRKSTNQLYQGYRIYTFQHNSELQKESYFINFDLIGLEKNSKANLYVFAEGKENYKLDYILSDKMIVTVGEVSPMKKIEEKVDNDHVKTDFEITSDSKGVYLTYEFKKKIEGNIGTFRIVSNKDTQIRIAGLICTNVKKDATKAEMYQKISQVTSQTSTCLSDQSTNENDLNSVFTYDENNPVLIIRINGGLGLKSSFSDSQSASIYLRTTAKEMSVKEEEEKIEETYSYIPFIVNLKKMREIVKDKDHISYVLLYSARSELQGFYLDKKENKPVSMFMGKILLLYTNPDLIKQKYHNIDSVIVLSSAFNKKEQGFVTSKSIYKKFYLSNAHIQYFVSEENGRPKKHPISIDLKDCSSPYYVLLNYNYIKSDKEPKDKVYIENLYGKQISFKTNEKWSSEETWDSAINSLTTRTVSNLGIDLDSTSHNHIDIFEFQCTIPGLHNLYFINPEDVKTKLLEYGEYGIYEMAPNDNDIELTFSNPNDYNYLFAFDVRKDDKTLGQEKPHPDLDIIIFYEKSNDTIHFKENGLEHYKSRKGLQKIVINNHDSQAGKTRIIVKTGYDIQNWNKIEYNISERISNTSHLYTYVMPQDESRLNYTSVKLDISTNQENVKFCVGSYIGTFINPSMENCYRVGINNPYSITFLNPLIMYSDFSYDNMKEDYYIGIKTVNVNDKLKIIPQLIKYDTDERNIEGYGNQIEILKSNNKTRVVLTSPKKKENSQFIFTQIVPCTKDRVLNYALINSYNQAQINTGHAEKNQKTHYSIINNPLLEVELEIKGQKNDKAYIKHTGLNENYQPNFQDFKITYSHSDKKLHIINPLKEELINYIIYMDEYDKLKSSTICDLVEKDITKFSKASFEFEKSDSEFDYSIDFNNKDIKDLKSFDILVFAQSQIHSKFAILSDVVQYNENLPSSSIIPSSDEDSGKTPTYLIIIIIVLSVIIVVLIALFVICHAKRKTSSQFSSSKIEGSSLADMGANSMAQPMNTNTMDP